MPTYLVRKTQQKQAKQKEVRTKNVLYKQKIKNALLSVAHKSLSPAGQWFTFFVSLPLLGRAHNACRNSSGGQAVVSESRLVPSSGSAATIPC